MHVHLVRRTLERIERNDRPDVDRSFDDHETFENRGNGHDRPIDRSIASPRTIEFFVHPPTHAPVAALADWRGRDFVFLFPLGIAFLFSFHFETIKDVRRGGRTRAHATPHWIIYKDRGWTLSMDAFSTGLPHNIRALNSNNRILLFPDVLFDRHHASEARMRAHIPSVFINSFFIREGTCLPISRWWNLPLRYHLSVIIYLADFVNLGCNCESICLSYMCRGIYYTTMSRNQIVRTYRHIFLGVTRDHPPSNPLFIGFWEI